MRSFTRRALVVSGLAVVASLAALLVLDLVASRRLAAARERFESEVAPLEYASLLRPELESSANAVTWIQAGASALVLPPPDQEAAARLAKLPAADWSPQDLENGARVVAQAGPALELLERSLGLPESSFGIDYPAGWQAELPDLMAVLRLLRLLEIDGILAVRAGDSERVARGLALIGRVADALAAESLVVTTLVALSADRRYLGLLAHALPVLEEPHLRSIRDELGQRSRHATLARALRADATMVARTSLTELTVETWEGPRFLARPTAWLTVPWQKRETARALDTFRHLISALEMTVPEARTRVDGDWRHMLVPNLLATTERFKATETSRLLAMSALQTRLARTDGAGYPEEPVLAPGAEPDPFAGGEIRYELRADGSASLTAEAAGRVWKEGNGSPAPPPPFAWELPPPSRPD